jgi:hypothetical protein
LFPELNLENCFNILNENKDEKIILVPNTYRDFNGANVNDMFAIGLPDTMKLYSESLDYFKLPVMSSVHMETILSQIWNANGIKRPITDFSVEIRRKGTGSQHTDFNPNFGRWE